MLIFELLFVKYLNYEINSYVAGPKASDSTMNVG